MIKEIELCGDVVVPSQEGGVEKYSLGKIVWTDSRGCPHVSYTLVSDFDQLSDDLKRESLERQRADAAIREKISSMQFEIESLKTQIEEILSRLGGEEVSRLYHAVFSNMPISETEPEDGSKYWGQITSESKEGTVDVDENSFLQGNMEVAEESSGNTVFFNQII